MASQQTSKAQPSKAQAPKPRAGGSSDIKVELREIPGYEYQKGALLDLIAATATKLGMSGTVYATALSQKQDPLRSVSDKTGKSTWRVELRRPVVGVDGVEECIVLQIRTSYTIPSAFGRK
ncbi:uncharacterized protein B0T15DRAFT_312909 [Chaetomium strumarium]|uniref:Uncharacterized protein n=1 Tax=Chaetomium strumarium TaxID=1170767 RepID=A0AAJ0GMJ3_9PEZI|nr:hypothetical protein B0T15DRAFT_312909 [Chaetomium strumarium]